VIVIVNTDQEQVAQAAGPLPVPVAEGSADELQPGSPFDPEDDGCEFSWIDDEESIIVPHVDAVAVYENTKGDIVIRQEAADPRLDDQVVVLRPEHARSVAAALVQLADAIEGSRR